MTTHLRVVNSVTGMAQPFRYAFWSGRQNFCWSEIVLDLEFLHQDARMMRDLLFITRAIFRFERERTKRNRVRPFRFDSIVFL